MSCWKATGMTEGEEVAVWWPWTSWIRICGGGGGWWVVVCTILGYCIQGVWKTGGRIVRLGRTIPPNSLLHSGLYSRVLFVHNVWMVFVHTLDLPIC